MHTDKQIVESVRKGEREGLEDMVNRYASQVFAMIVKQVPNSMDAQELTQDTFLKAFENISSYDSHQSSLSTWLCRIAYRLILDFQKRRRPVVVPLDENPVSMRDFSDEELDAAFSTGNEQGIERLQELISELPDEDQMLLVLYYYENHPLTEIAFITGSSPNVLSSRLYRIRKKLYKKLKEI